MAESRRGLQRVPNTKEKHLCNIVAARERCRKAHPNVGCEKQGQIIYERCKSGWVEIGFDRCGPPCPSGMKDIGISCAKGKRNDSIAAEPLRFCPTGKEIYHAFCYTPCLTGLKGADTL